MSHAAPKVGQSLSELVEEAAHILPSQGPLSSFVHHNTLHAFEHLPFDEALLAASALYGTEPYQSEAAFRAHLESSRILNADLAAVVQEDFERKDLPLTEVIPGLDRRTFQTLRLRHLFEVPKGASLEWHLIEGEALRSLHPLVSASRHRTLRERAARLYGHLGPKKRLPALLEALFRAFDQSPQSLEPERTSFVRRRDQLLAQGAKDLDVRVHPLVFRLTAAFLDQGIASWAMPAREEGLLTAARAVLAPRLTAPDGWTRAVAREFRRQQAAQESAETTLRQALERLRVQPEDFGQAIEASLIRVRGYAGMVRQFEVCPERTPIAPQPARLLDFAALLLSLEAVAAELEERAIGEGSPPRASAAKERTEADRSLAYEAFVFAQIADVEVIAFEDPKIATAWREEIKAFDAMTRRRLLHQAYERRLSVPLLDGLAAHPPQTEGGMPSFQAVFCIDDRECSFRRHLEESYPEVSTYGYAGFFGVAMAWQGLNDVRPQPLCPVNLRPTHAVTERALNPEEVQRWQATKKRRGFVMDAMTSSARRPISGLLTTSLGAWSMIPLVARCLFPRLAHRVLGRVARPEHELRTRLALWRESDQRDPEGRLLGYSKEEAADVVQAALVAMGLTQNFAPILVVLGHGSSSLNNPHGAAYDCGATGGGRGGPNARVFAAMANCEAVREILATRGIRIPRETWVLGGYHNTCDDSVICFDEDLIPESQVAVAASVMAALDEAAALNAHERCRRFESAPKTQDATMARMHVEGRSVDLAQPRPECGHATNAYAIVGRRARTRGLFLDRRAFLVSYDPKSDPEGIILGKLLDAVVPVGAGINLEYYFSYVDPQGYGCGSKLPHNITGLFGVMNGHRSDLRTGLPWQMVEIHEPVRLHCVVEAHLSVLACLHAERAGLRRLIDNEWILLTALCPDSQKLWRFQRGQFLPYEPELRHLATVSTSPEFYRGEMGHLSLAAIQSARRHSSGAQQTEALSPAIGGRS